MLYLLLVGRYPFEDPANPSSFELTIRVPGPTDTDTDSCPQDLNVSENYYMDTA